MATKFRSLNLAAAAGNLEAVQELLNRKVPIDTPRGRYSLTPLIEAIAGDHTEVALCLVEHGADPNLAGKLACWTPLIWAAIRSEKLRHGNVQLVEALLNAGAEVDKPDTESTMTPLMWAANRRSVKVVQLLLAHGADVNAQTTEEGNANRTALMYADGLAVIRVLLNAGADPKVIEEGGMHTWEFHRGATRKLLKELAEAK